MKADVVSEMIGDRYQINHWLISSMDGFSPTITANMKGSRRLKHLFKHQSDPETKERRAYLNLDLICVTAPPRRQFIFK